MTETAAGSNARRPKHRIAAWTLFAAALMAGSVHAQGLTRSEAGRVAVAQCYAQCLSGEGAAELFRIYLDAFDGRWTQATVQYVNCLSLQTAAIGVDACRAGCLDIETAYKVKSSHIRTRYLRLMNETLRVARTSGLWSAWNRYPDPNSDAFVRACARLGDVVVQARAQASKLEAIEPESPAALKARRQAVIANEYQPEPPFELEPWDE